MKHIKNFCIGAVIGFFISNLFWIYFMCMYGTIIQVPNSSDHLINHMYDPILVAMYAGFFLVCMEIPTYSKTITFKALVNDGTTYMLVLPCFFAIILTYEVGWMSSIAFPIMLCVSFVLLIIWATSAWIFRILFVRGISLANDLKLFK